jgi:hypothetical protein
MWCRVFRFWHQNRQLRFGDLSLKITATVSLFGTQNQAGFGLSLVPQNRRREVGTRHASRSSGLLRVEASRARIFNLASRLAEARRRMLHVHHHRSCIGVKLKTDRSMRRAASNPAILTLPFSFY